MLGVVHMIVFGIVAPSRITSLYRHSMENQSSGWMN